MTLNRLEIVPADNPGPIKSGLKNQRNQYANSKLFFGGSHRRSTLRTG